MRGGSFSLWGPVANSLVPVRWSTCFTLCCTSDKSVVMLLFKTAALPSSVASASVALLSLPVIKFNDFQSSWNLEILRLIKSRDIRLYWMKISIGFPLGRMTYFSQHQTANFRSPKLDVLSQLYEAPLYSWQQRFIYMPEIFEYFQI